MKNTKYLIKVKRAYLVFLVLKLFEFFVFLDFQVVVVTTFLFTTNVLYRKKEHELNILDPGDLPEVDPLGCVKAKESFDGWIPEKTKVKVANTFFCSRSSDMCEEK